jgi:hypothetical protein
MRRKFILQNLTEFFDSSAFLDAMRYYETNYACRDAKWREVLAEK